MTQQGAIEPLPRGRHGLTRQQVVQSQRARIFRAMADTMADKGYAATSVADVLRAAKVSRETFYEQFDSKEDCFMSALEAATDVVLAQAFATRPTGGTPLERFDSGLRTYLDALAAQPALSRLFLIEVYAAGPAALERRAARAAAASPPCSTTRSAGGPRVTGSPTRRSSPPRARWSRPGSRPTT